MNADQEIESYEKREKKNDQGIGEVTALLTGNQRHALRIKKSDTEQGETTYAHLTADGR
jgi:hypothetical protein